MEREKSTANAEEVMLEHNETDNVSAQKVLIYNNNC